MSVESKMTAIADEIRVMTGGTSALSLDAMATDLEDANEELDTQAELIEDIMGLLEGKAIDGSALQAKTVSPTKARQIVRPDGNYQGLSQVTVEAISDDYIQPNGTLNITENGTYDVREYASVAVNVAGGMVVKSGTATSGTINTGLSDIEQFFIYKESVNATGLIHLHYSKSATSRMYASAWSTSSWGSKTITNGTGGVTVSGGTLTISATQAAQGALTSGVTYKWIAVGKE